jgi:hypothetical protein
VSSTTGENVPLVPWYVVVQGEPLSEVEYIFLCELYESNVCSIELFKRWHDHSFGGVYPEKLWYDLVRKAPSLVVESSLYSLKNEPPLNKEGVCVYDRKEGYQAVDSSTPTRIMADDVVGGVILMYSGGGKSHYIRNHPNERLVDGDSLVDFPAGWSKDRKLRKYVMTQYENNVLQSALAGRTVLVNVNDERIIDRWMKAGVVVGYVPVTKETLDWRAREKLLRPDQVGRARHRVVSQQNWAKRGVQVIDSLEEAVDRAKRCIRSADTPLLPTLLAIIKKNQYDASKHGWMARRIFPGTSKMLDEREQVSVPLAMAMAQQQIQNHHCGFDDVGQVLQLCVGLGGQMVTNVVVWCCGLDGGWRELLRIQALFGFFNGDLKQFMEVTKIFHGLVRNTDDVSWFDGVYSADHYMYFNLLPGRFFFSHLNFKSELTSRMTPGRPINDSVYGQPEGSFENLVENVIDYLSHLFAEGSVAQAHVDLETFCADFLTWSTSGSAPNRGLVLVMPDGSEMRSSGGNKSAQLNRMGVAGILECLAMDPSCVGQPTYKFEAGKLRMLLPGPMYHWVVESLALWGGEGHVLRGVPEIALEQNSYIEFVQMTNRLTSTAGDMARACSDYADYNILHTFERMKKLWLSHAEALDSRLRLPDDKMANDKDSILNFVRQACRWTAAALDDVRAKIGAEEYVRLVRGLWTGWRSTMYINVTFNFAYTTAQRLLFIRKYGMDPLSRYNVLGDDMEGDSPSLWTALKFVSLIDPLGLDAQASKQMVSMRRAEFLRLMYRDGATISGSYCRGITGFTSGDTQTSPRYAGIKSAQNVCDGINRLIRRGGCSVRLEEMKNLLVKHWCAVKVNGNTYRPTNSVLRSPTWLGGMGICRYDGSDARFERVAPARTRKVRFKQKDSQLSKLMVQKGWNIVKLWNTIPSLDHGDVDANIMAGVMPSEARKEFAMMERQDTAAYYKQKGHKLKMKIVPELFRRFEETLLQTEKIRVPMPKVTQRPDEWWKGLMRDALGPLAAHPKADRLVGRTGPEKLKNVISRATDRVTSAREKLLKLDEQTRLATVTGNLETPSPLAGLVSQLSRHLIALCHSHIIEWLKLQQCRTVVAWNQCAVNALYTFERFFLEYQYSLVEKYRV